MELERIPPGTILARRYGIYDHVGILGEKAPWRDRTVISASGSEGKVIEQKLADFASSGQVCIKGYPGSLAPLEVIARAREMLGRPYNLICWNCDHLVRFAHGLPVVSPQLRIAGAALMALVLAVRVARK